MVHLIFDSATTRDDDPAIIVIKFIDCTCFAFTPSVGLSAGRAIFRMRNSWFKKYRRAGEPKSTHNSWMAYVSERRTWINKNLPFDPSSSSYLHHEMVCVYVINALKNHCILIEMQSGFAWVWVSTNDVKIRKRLDRNRHRRLCRRLKLLRY